MKRLFSLAVLFLAVACFSAFARCSDFACTDDCAGCHMASYVFHCASGGQDGYDIYVCCDDGPTCAGLSAITNKQKDVKPQANPPLNIAGQLFATAISKLTNLFTAPVHYSPILAHETPRYWQYVSGKMSQEDGSACANKPHKSAAQLLAAVDQWMR